MSKPGTLHREYAKQSRVGFERSDSINPNAREVETNRSIFRTRPSLRSSPRASGRIWKAQNKQKKKRKETGGNLGGQEKEKEKEDEEQDEVKANEVAENGKESKADIEGALAIVSPLVPSHKSPV